MKKVFCFLLLSTWLCGAHGAEQQRPNVLFIAVDDMRMNMGCYGDPIAVTPNIDKLASSSLLFTRAYCQFASCNASRASVLTGMRPDSISVWQLNTHYRNTAPDVVTLPQHFKVNGYHTESIGKVLHNYGKIKDDELSWSTPARLDKLSHFNDYVLPENTAKKAAATECADVDDDAYHDGKITIDAENTIKRLASKKKPFFLAVGFMKPHSPYNAPKKFWDLYEGEDIEALCPVDRPEGMSELNWVRTGEMRGYGDLPRDGNYSREQSARMRHGYYAATSYLDANIGRVLKALEESGARDNTIIVFWSDHGYHLGENSQWAKVTVRDLDAQVPLLVTVPGESGARTDAIVEYIDMYPTLSDLCGLPEPVEVDGKSFIDVVRDPSVDFKEAAMSQICRPWKGQGPIEEMGYSIRSANYRYTLWLDHETKEVLSEELYELETDPYQRENIVKNASPEVLSQHRKSLVRILN